MDIADQIKNAITENDMELAQRLAHTVKGVCGNIAAKDVFIHAEAVESAIKKNAEKEYENLLKNLSESLDFVFKSICVLENKEEDATDENAAQKEDIKPVDTSKAEMLMVEIKELLEEDYEEAENRIESLKDILGPKYKKDISKLKNQISEFDLDGAAETLNNIADILGITLK